MLPLTEKTSAKKFETAGKSLGSNKIITGKVTQHLAVIKWSGEGWLFRVAKYAAV